MVPRAIIEIRLWANNIPFPYCDYPDPAVAHLRASRSGTQRSRWAGPGSEPTWLTIAV